MEDDSKRVDKTSASREVQLLYGTSDKYGIYQLKDNPELRDFHFAGTSELLRRGILSDTFKEIAPENYNLLYVGELDGIKHETQSQALDELFLKFNLGIPGDFRGHSLSVSDIVVLHEDGKNSVHFVDSFGFTKLPEFARRLEESKDWDREQAYRVGDCYLMLHESDEGYDYTLFDMDYREVDGGVFDDLDAGMDGVLADLLTELGQEGDASEMDVPVNAAIPVDYGELEERVEEANRITPERIVDYIVQNADEMAAENGISPVVADFKAKTREMFHEIDGLSSDDIEEIVKGYVREKIDEYGFAAEIVDAALDGTRCRGLERHGSDLDVVIELSTDEREDVLFDTFHEDGFCIGGVKVDINPITTQRTGTLETYLPQAEDYLDGVREARRKELEKRPSLKEKLEEKKSVAEKRSNQTQSKVIDKGVEKDML